jgi:anti-sigma B factor antagonist
MSQAPSPHHLQVDCRHEGGTMFVALSGEFDINGGDDFERTVDRLADGARNIVVDLTQLTFIDSSGMRALIAVWEQARTDGFDLAVVPGTGQVRRAMELTGVDKVLPEATGANPLPVASPADASAG